MSSSVVLNRCCSPDRPEDARFLLENACIAPGNLSSASTPTGSKQSNQFDVYCHLTKMILSNMLLSYLMSFYTSIVMLTKCSKRSSNTFAHNKLTSRFSSSKYCAKSFYYQVIYRVFQQVKTVCVFQYFCIQIIYLFVLVSLRRSQQRHYQWCSAITIKFYKHPNKEYEKTHI